MVHLVTTLHVLQTDFRSFNTVTLDSIVGSASFLVAAPCSNHTSCTGQVAPRNQPPEANRREEKKKKKDKITSRIIDSQYGLPSCGESQRIPLILRILEHAGVFAAQNSCETGIPGILISSVNRTARWNGLERVSADLSRLF